MNRSYLKIISAALLAVFMLSGFWSGKSVEEQRQAVQKMKKETLEKLYNMEPEAKKMLQNAYGYAVFSDIGVNVIFVSAGGGSGVAHNNRTGKDTYMKMGTVGVGLGLGIKDFRGVFLFENQKVYDDFVNKGWEANAQADAAAKADDKGGAVGGAISVAPGVRLYQMTESGLALQATIQGTKYWKDAALNK
jgi:lipid-binding SYLF domain-containing protein